MKTYCLKCKKNTENLDPKIFRIKKKKRLNYCNRNVMIVKTKSQDL